MAPKDIIKKLHIVVIGVAQLFIQEEIIMYTIWYCISYEYELGTGAASYDRHDQVQLGVVEYNRYLTFNNSLIYNHGSTVGERNEANQVGTRYRKYIYGIVYQ